MDNGKANLLETIGEMNKNIAQSESKIIIKNEINKYD